jgi:hypothetical protein
MRPTVEEEIERFLRTGEDDVLCAAWPGGPLERARRGSEALLEALVTEVRRRSASRKPLAAPPEMDLKAFTRAKVEPMVRGLFPARERDPVLALLERSVVFLTPGDIERVLRETSFLSSAWRLANIYLDSLGAEVLGDDEGGIVGYSEETTCYVSLEYFVSDNPFADFVVHEVAHIFHNCKRRTAGLPETRTREWLLDIEYRKRETFAYACEAYSRILELGKGSGERKRLLAELERGSRPSDDRVDGNEYVDILREAVSARNGWKRILGRCAPRRRKGP